MFVFSLAAPRSLNPSEPAHAAAPLRLDHPRQRRGGGGGFLKVRLRQSELQINGVMNGNIITGGAGAARILRSFITEQLAEIPRISRRNDRRHSVTSNEPGCNRTNQRLSGER